MLLEEYDSANLPKSRVIIAIFALHLGNLLGLIFFYLTNDKIREYIILRWVVPSFFLSTEKCFSDFLCEKKAVLLPRGFPFVILVGKSRLLQSGCVAWFYAKFFLCILSAKTYFEVCAGKFFVFIDFVFHAIAYRGNAFSFILWEADEQLLLDALLVINDKWYCLAYSYENKVCFRIVTILLSFIGEWSAIFTHLSPTWGFARSFCLCTFKIFFAEFFCEMEKSYCLEIFNLLLFQLETWV